MELVPQECHSFAGPLNLPEKVEMYLRLSVLRSRVIGEDCGIIPGELEQMRMESLYMAVCIGKQLQSLDHVCWINHKTNTMANLALPFTLFILDISGLMVQKNV